MKEEYKVKLAFIAVCFFWGSTYLGIKVGIQYFPPLIFAGVRFVVAGLIMLGYALIKKHHMPTLKTLMPIVVVGCLLLTGGNGLVTIAVESVDTSIASIMIAMVPIYIALIELIVYKKKKMSNFGYSGLILGFIGVYLLIKPSGDVLNKGIILLILAPMLWSIGSVYSKKISKEIHIVSNIAIQMLSGGLLLIFLGLFKGEVVHLNTSLNGYLALLYLIIFGSIVGYSSYIYVLEKWPAAKAGTYAYVNPVVAMLLGSIFLKEIITLRMLISMAIILFGVFIVQKSKTLKE